MNWVIFFVLSYFTFAPKRVQSSADESRLLNDLLKDYQVYERPVDDESKSVQLEFTISLQVNIALCSIVSPENQYINHLFQQIIDLDEQNQLLRSNLWLTYEWYDPNLKWNQVRILLFKKKKYFTKLN